MNETSSRVTLIGWIFTRTKNVSFGMKMLQKLSPSLYFKKTVPRVSLFLTLSATANTVHGVILRACKCDTQALAFFSLKTASSIARGSSPYQATWMYMLRFRRWI
jgi:hypothetical protein